jgi:hypothetical protein
MIKTSYEAKVLLSITYAILFMVVFFISLGAAA